MLPREYTLSQYDRSPPLTACKMLVIVVSNEASDCCLTPNEQYEELGISKNSGKPYKNTNFDKGDILTNHKSFMSTLNIPINEENCELSTLY
jgi:glutathione peroxidase-family protein